MAIELTMFITLAYTNDPTYQYDLKGGLLKHSSPVTVFTLEVATSTALSDISGTPLQTVLLDGQKWELPVKVRKAQKVTTLPNLVLAGTKIASTLQNYKSWLLAWYYAQSRWIATDELQDTTQPQNLVKVVRSQETLAFEQVNGISWAERCVLDFETAGVYQS